MSEPFIGQIQPFGFNFAPRGWALCEGQLLPISQNTALFSLLGTIYGGDGRTTFALPDLRGRVAISSGAGPGLSNYQIGQRGGQEQVSLSNPNQLPAHTHSLGCNRTAANSDTPVDAVPAVDEGATESYHTSSTDSMLPTGSTGASAGHENRQPFLVVNYCIALTGLFPSRN